ncbi:APC family permease [Mycobacterium sp. 94-17]|nr:APC family permease [Mycobacterium sp. 94-17]
MGDSADCETIPASLTDVCKRVFLGKPMITEDLQHQKLSNTVALGALSPDAVSSVAYGPEQIMVELLPAAGMAAFVLLLPLTGVILVILALVAASYRQVVMAYTRAGGSYIVARENFGPRIAQIAAAALLIDYVVTVAIQCAAGTVAVASAIPALGPYSLEITIGSVLVFSFLNLRGLREAGRTFAVPTYAFISMLTLVVVVGLVREIFGNLPVYDVQHLDGTVQIQQGNGLIMGATVLVILRAFANGGSSLTGVEAISNTVNLFREPQGINARRVLTIMAWVLGILLAGVAWLTYATHSVPFAAGYPSMLSEVGRAVFGNGTIGNFLYFALQAASAAILYNGANTSFNGFPALAHFVAEDRFLPRPLMKRGHRLVFSNAIIVLTVLAVTLLIATGGSVNALVPLFAMGVFSAFAMAGFGMTKHHLRQRNRGWRYKLVVNFSAGVLSALVVGIFATAKFNEGAWLIVVVFPALVFVLMRLNRKYRAEASVLEMSTAEQAQLDELPHHRVFLFVDSIDLAEIEALRYAKGLRADELTAVHFVLDAMRARSLRKFWDLFEHDTHLQMIECPQRQLRLAAYGLVRQVLSEHPDARVTVLLPRRTYSPLVGRLLHDRTADKIARTISRIPNASAQIVVFDVESRVARTARAGRLKASLLSKPERSTEKMGTTSFESTAQTSTSTTSGV